MTLTADNLVGYLRAEFHKSGRLRVWLFSIQLLSAVPAAVSVVVPDRSQVLLYSLAVASVASLIAWWFFNEFYVSANSAGQAALRAAILLGGLGGTLSPSEIQILRERFTITSKRAQESEVAGYYATTAPKGPTRLAEMVEELLSIVNFYSGRVATRCFCSLSYSRHSS